MADYRTIPAAELGKALDIYVLKAFRRGVGRGTTEAFCPGYGRDNGYVACAFFGKIPERGSYHAGKSNAVRLHCGKFGIRVQIHILVAYARAMKIYIHAS